MSGSGAVQDGSFYMCSVAQIFMPSTAELLNISGNPRHPQNTKIQSTLQVLFFWLFLFRRFHAGVPDPRLKTAGSLSHKLAGDELPKCSSSLPAQCSTEEVRANSSS